MSRSVGRGMAPGSQPGTYILLIYLRRRASLTIGRLGSHRFSRGWYLYVGSAFGPGGVAARCNHHWRVSPRPRWHIDYLRAAAPLRAIWFSHAVEHLEHIWAGVLGGTLGLSVPVEGFGASDCSCSSHLFYAASRPNIRHFSVLAQSHLGGNARLYESIVKSGDKCH